MTIPSWAKVGAKVAAIYDGTRTTIKKGDIFTIKEVSEYLNRGEAEGYGVKVHEHPTPASHIWWPLAAFRPVQTKTLEQDVAQFAHHLKTVKERV